MAKAQFIGRVIPKNAQITLIVPISMSNSSQTKDGFEALIDLVIATDSIINLEIIIGADLYAHYWGDQAAIEEDKKWREDNLSALKKLEIAGKNYKLISWNELRVLPAFSENEKKIAILYQEDKEFHSIVDVLSSEHAQKQNTSTQGAINFLLEECAAFLTIKGYVAYPSKNINEAISEAVKKLGKVFEYCPYNISYTKTRALIPQMLSSDHPLLTVFRQAIMELDKNGITDNNGRIVFFKGILRQISNDSKKKTDRKQGETIY